MVKSVLDVRPGLETLIDTAERDPEGSVMQLSQPARDRLPEIKVECCDVVADGFVSSNSFPLCTGRDSFRTLRSGTQQPCCHRFLRPLWSACDRWKATQLACPM